MATTTGPLMSLDASGTIGGTIVYSKWKGRNYVRRHVVPSNPRLPKQIGVRALLSFLANQWSALKATIEASWVNLAEGENITNLNAYVRENFARLKTGRGLTQKFPAAEISDGASAPTVVGSPGDGFMSLAITKGADPPTWGWMVHLYPVTGAAIGLPNLRLIVPYIESPQTVVIAGLTNTDWFAKVIGTNDDGIMGTASTEEEVDLTPA